MVEVLLSTFKPLMLHDLGAHVREPATRITKRLPQAFFCFFFWGGVLLAKMKKPPSHLLEFSNQKIGHLPVRANSIE